MQTASWNFANGVLHLSLADQVRVDLEDRYREPQRAYHNLQHLAECFDRLAEVRHRIKDRDQAVVSLALWFHDAVYDTRRSDNEEQSATLAERVLLESGAGTELARELADLVLATKHDCTPQTTLAQWLVDIDLAILAAPSTRFDEYEQQVRREYEWVPDADFRFGRARILRQFIDRAYVFETDDFRDRYEVAARANLARSLAKLMESS